MISEPDIYITHYGVSLKAAYGSDKYAIYMCPGDVALYCAAYACACHNLPRIASATLSSTAIVHCCVPIAYYRMARTIRFYSRSPRYFRRG